MLAVTGPVGLNDRLPHKHLDENHPTLIFLSSVQLPSTGVKKLKHRTVHLSLFTEDILNSGALPPSDLHRVSATYSGTDMNLTVSVTVYHAWTKQEVHTKL